MKHVLYLSDNTRVCEYPDKLGKSFVYNEPSTRLGDGCKECLALLFADNQRAFEREANERLMCSRDESVYKEPWLLAAAFWALAGASFAILCMILWAAILP